MFDNRGLSLHVWKAGDHQKGKMSFSEMKVMKSDSARRSLSATCTEFAVPISSHLPRSPLRHSDSRSFGMKVSIMKRNEPMICSLKLGLAPVQSIFQRVNSASCSQLFSGIVISERRD